MQVSNKGHTLLAAVRVWSPPELAGPAVSVLHSAEWRIGTNSYEAELLTPLEADLVRRLRSEELLSSALREAEDPTSRYLVPPAAYFGYRIMFEWRKSAIICDNVRLHRVEIFPSHRVPSNVTNLSGVLRSVWSPGKEKSQSEVAADTSFKFDAHYAHVWLNGTEYSLSPMQAAIVRELHAAYLAGNPYVHVETLRDTVGFETPKLSGLFQRMPGWRTLIHSDRRGNYRLNL